MRLKTIFAIAIGTIATLSNSLGLRAETENIETEMLDSSKEQIISYITPIYKGIQIPILSLLHLKCKIACPVQNRELTEDNIQTFQYYESDFERELATVDEIAQLASTYTGTINQNYDLMNAIYTGKYVLSNAKQKGSAAFQMLGNVELSCGTVAQLGNLLLKVSTNFPNAIKLLQPTISKGQIKYASCFPVPPTNMTTPTV